MSKVHCRRRVTTPAQLMVLSGHQPEQRLPVISVITAWSLLRPSTKPPSNRWVSSKIAVDPFLSPHSDKFRRRRGGFEDVVIFLSSFVRLADIDARSQSAVRPALRICV